MERKITMRHEARRDGLIGEMLSGRHMPVDSGLIREYESTRLVVGSAASPTQAKTEEPKTASRKLTQREMFPGVKF
jgi:hypothetical protein